MKFDKTYKGITFKVSFGYIDRLDRYKFSCYAFDTENNKRLSKDFSTFGKSSDINDYDSCCERFFNERIYPYIEHSEFDKCDRTLLKEMVLRVDENTLFKIFPLPYPYEHCRVQLVDKDYKPLSKKFLAPLNYCSSKEQWEEIIKLYFANVDIE